MELSLPPHPSQMPHAGPVLRSPKYSTRAQQPVLGLGHSPHTFSLLPPSPPHRAQAGPQACPHTALPDVAHSARPWELPCPLSSPGSLPSQLCPVLWSSLNLSAPRTAFPSHPFDPESLPFALWHGWRLRLFFMAVTRPAISLFFTCLARVCPVRW